MTVWKMGAALVVSSCITAITAGAAAQGGPPKWTVGGIGLLYESPFEAEGSSLKAFPYVSYRGERFYFEGLELGYRLLPKPSNPDDLHLSFDLIGSARMLPGSSRDKVTADLGARFGLHGGFGSLSAEFLQDVTDTHNGQEISLGYSYSFRSDKLMITPGVKATWQSGKLANHMWGVTEKQRTKMREKGDPLLPLYSLSDDVINYSAELMALYSVDDRWSIIAFGSASYLDKKVRANPGITKDYDLTIGLGVGYSF